ncbi:MAG: beta-lactamase family protein [Chloroflexi bacterium]|nr:beta-lactamase family protein [Chloroflexota bacterium]
MIDRQFIAKPSEIGLDEGRLQRLYDFVEGEVRAGLPSAQVAVGRRGRLAGVRTFGTATRGGLTGPATDDTLYCIYSSTKGIVGVAVWGLIEDGGLRIEERVADIIPEFAGKEKDGITVEQVMLHIGGFPYAPMHPDLWESREKRLERIKYWRITWQPGSRFEYHATAAHWILAELITRRTGLDFRDYVRRRITEPMGVPELFVGLPDEFHARAADVEYVGDPVAPEGGWKETNPDTVLHFNLPSQRRAGAPGAGAFAGAGELALFYQRLVSVNESGAHAPLRPETIEMATTVRTKDHHVDELSGLPVNRALAVVVAGDHPLERGFGAHGSSRAFGHGGAGGQIAWGDPETGLSVGFVTNGFVDNERIRDRGRAISTLAAEALV